jgi:hypothetical protein
MSAAWFVLAVLASRSAASVLGVLESTAPDLVGWACESSALLPGLLRRR